MAAVGLSGVASVIAGLIAWGARGERRALFAEFNTVRAEIKTLRAELTAGLAEAENRFFQRVNGSYIRKELHNDMVARIDRIENRVEDLE